MRGVDDTFDEKVYVRAMPVSRNSTFRNLPQAEQFLGITHLKV
ncbi:hypothetical protein, partial [Metallosphaera javensis (ex Hofmann et al. 2022)]